MPKEWGNGNIKMVIIFLNFNIIVVTCITVDQEISCENWALIVLQPDRDIGYVLKKDRNKINGKENGRHERNRSKSTWRWWGLREKMVDTEAKVGMWQSVWLGYPVLSRSNDHFTYSRLLSCLSSETDTYTSCDLGLCASCFQWSSAEGNPKWDRKARREHPCEHNPACLFLI